LRRQSVCEKLALSRLRIRTIDQESTEISGGLK
jgi:hypothetical protein